MPPLVATVPRHRVVSSLAALALCAVAICSAGANASASTTAASGTNAASVSWPTLASTFTWPVLKPTATAGLRVGQIAPAPGPCSANASYQGYSATYGNAPGRWFQLFVSKGRLCGNPPAAVLVSHVRINGQSAPVYAWRFGPKKPTLADGYRNGMTVSWKQGATSISIESTQLRLPEVLRIAQSLSPVAR